MLKSGEKDSTVSLDTCQCSFLYRQISGAMIRISNCEDRDAAPNLDRTITITGNSESVALAQYLINMR